MLHEQFWSLNELKKCRGKISEFLKNPQICLKFDDVTKKELENALYDLIYSITESIFRAVDREYYREDVITKIKEFFGKNGETILKSLPISEIDEIVDKWQDDLSDSDMYWEANWDTLDNVLEETVWLSDIRKYKRSDVRLYGVYLKDWYASHTEGEPSCINEFFACEMQDEKLKEYYMKLLTNVMGPKQKQKDKADYEFIDVLRK